MAKLRFQSVDEVCRACPGWGIRYEAFADGPGRWYAVHPAYGFSAERPLAARSAASLVAQAWAAEAAGPRPAVAWRRRPGHSVTPA